jgi:hypothetical protein
VSQALVTALQALDLSAYNVVDGEPRAVELSAEQAAAALRMTANGVADGDMGAATRWLQEKLIKGGVAGLETAVSQLSG